MPNDSPCRLCVPPDRQPGCHTWCERGLEWERKEKARKECIAAAKKKDYDASETIISLKERIKKGK